MIMLGNKGDAPMGATPGQAMNMNVQTAPAPQQAKEQEYGQAPANMSDEEIRIEDIPF